MNCKVIHKSAYCSFIAPATYCSHKGFLGFIPRSFASVLRLQVGLNNWNLLVCRLVHSSPSITPSIRPANIPLPPYWGRQPKAEGGPYCHEQCFLFCYPYCAPAGQISTNEPIQLKLGSSVATASGYRTNVPALQSDAYRLSYGLPKLAFIFRMY